MITVETIWIFALKFNKQITDAHAHLHGETAGSA